MLAATNDWLKTPMAKTEEGINIQYSLLSYNSNVY